MPMRAYAKHGGLRAVSRWAATVLALFALSGVPTDAESRGGTLERLRATLNEAERERDDGHLARAAVLYRRAGEEASGLGGANLPLARALDGLADVHRLAGRPADAAELYVRSAAMWETLLGGRQPRLAITLHNLGIVYLAQERGDLAAPHLHRALEIWEATLGPASAQAQETGRALRRVEAQTRSAAE
jgi:tetratricopeptide (TPR) repeat protein